MTSQPPHYAQYVILKGHDPEKSEEKREASTPKPVYRCYVRDMPRSMVIEVHIEYLRREGVRLEQERLQMERVKKGGW